MKNRKTRNLFQTSLLKLLTVASFFSLPVLTPAAPGDLDPTFGLGGRVRPPDSSINYSSGEAIAIQPDHKILVAGAGYDFLTKIFGMTVTRYLPNGSPDPTFGSSGRTVVFDAPEGGDISLQTDGKIVVAAGFKIVRFLPNGNLDLSFGQNGVVSLIPYYAERVASQANGKIVVAASNGTQTLFAVMRFNPDGSPDASFGSGGIVTTTFGSYQHTSLTGLAFQGGKILAAGDVSNRNPNGGCASCGIAISRYNSDGSLDLSFGNAGKVVTFNQAVQPISSDMVVQPDGRIVIAGRPDHGDLGGIVMRYLPDGSPDVEFGTASVTIVPGSYFRAVALQGNGKIVLSGGTSYWSPSTTHHVVVRLLENGSLDSSFGSNGRLTTDFPDISSDGFFRAGWSYDVAVQADGKIVTAGDWSRTDGDGNAYWTYLAVARYIGDFVPTPRVQFDFDGDSRADISVFRPGDAVWYLNRSTQGFTAAQFGLATDDLAPADYDGDGKTDIAIFRNGAWWMIRSSDQTIASYQFGQAGDIPVPADYTGDGRDEIAVYRNGEWWSQDLNNGHWNLSNWGVATDRPVPADYDGDGRMDPAVYRDGTWYLLRSTLGQAAGQFGLPTDTPIPADYDGDAKTDLAVFRGGTWYVLQSTNGFTAFTWGVGSDVPVPADYDGDGKSDAAIFRDGQWWLLQSTSGIAVQHFGQTADKPIQAAYLQ